MPKQGNRIIIKAQGRKDHRQDIDGCYIPRKNPPKILTHEKVIHCIPEISHRHPKNDGFWKYFPVFQNAYLE